MIFIEGLGGSAERRLPRQRIRPIIAPHVQLSGQVLGYVVRQCMAFYPPDLPIPLLALPDCLFRFLPQIQIFYWLILQRLFIPGVRLPISQPVRYPLLDVHAIRSDGQRARVSLQAFYECR